MKEAEIRRGDWIDPDAGKILFGTYADTWIHDHVLKPRTEELYRGLPKNHLKPTFGSVDLGKIHDGDVRRWRKERLNAGLKQPRPFGPVTVAKAYRLMHAIMTTAVEDGLIRRNPCHLTGAGQEHSDERPVIPSRRSSSSSTASRRGTGRCCSWRPSPTCASANSRACAGISSTLTRAKFE